MFVIAYVTKHAAKRTKQRLGIPQKSAEKNARLALEKGVRHSETSGSLNRYLTGLYLNRYTANNIRIFNNHVYIFQDSKLITVYLLPAKYRRTVEKILEARKNANSKTD